MAKRKKRKIRWDRVLIVFGPLFLLILIVHVGCRHRSEESSISETSAEVESMDLGESAAETTVSGEAVPAEQVQKTFTICIDPGHGGGDGGAVNQSNTRFEKDDNLRLALAVRDAFAKYPYIQTIMTRETDVFLGLQNRCDIANEANADFFISLHRNSAEEGNGVEIWIMSDAAGDNSWDKLMAEYILDWLTDVGVSKRRGIQNGFRNTTINTKNSNYYVNQYTNMPSCLIEMGFMTADIDNRYFDEKLNDYADAIAGAMVELLTDKGLYQAAQPQ